MNVLDLFSGVGLMSLGLGWAGMRTVGFCEIEPACRFWLREQWPTVPIFEDVRSLTGEVVLERCCAVDLVAGGFPCQPVSVAGARRGTEDARWLWPEMFRLVRELRPRWVLAENVPGLRRGVVARPGERQREWEAPRLADAAATGRAGAGAAGTHEGRPGPDTSSRCDDARQPESGLGGPVDGSARRLARHRSAARRARLRAWGNGVYAPLVADIGRAIERANLPETAEAVA